MYDFLKQPIYQTLINYTPVALLAAIGQACIIVITAKRRKEKVDAGLVVAGFLLGLCSVWFVGEIAIWSGVSERFAMAIAGGLSTGGILAYEKLLEKIIGKVL
jgi:hypothetical protein